MTTVEELINYIENNKENVQYKEINFDDIVFSPFVHLKCMNCGMYKRNYHCLTSPTWDKNKLNLSKYGRFFLLYIKADNRERIEGLLRSNADRIEEGRKPMNDYIVKRNACNANQSKLYSGMKRFLISLSNDLNTKGIKLFGAGGGCRSCRVCGLIKPQKTGEDITPCKYPNKSYTSPEAIGIDVYGTLRNSGIDFSVIPVYKLINVGMIAMNKGSKKLSKEEVQELYKTYVDMVDLKSPVEQTKYIIERSIITEPVIKVNPSSNNLPKDFNKQVIVIPSRGRPNVIRKRTLKLIAGTKNVYIVIEKEDIKKYNNIKDIELIVLPESNMGLTYARRYIQEYFRNKARYVWQLDDNLDQFVHRFGLTEGGNPKLRPIEEQNIKAQQIFDETLAIMKEKEYIQMTISFRPSNWYQDNLFKENTRSWGIVLNDNKKMLDNDILYDVKCKLFQDYDIVAQMLYKGFVNACFYEYAFHKKMAGYKSGCSDYRNETLALEVCDYLRNKYDGFVKFKFSKKHNIIEPNFLWKNLRDNKKNNKVKYNNLEAERNRLNKIDIEKPIIKLKEPVSTIIEIKNAPEKEYVKRKTKEEIYVGQIEEEPEDNWDWLDSDDEKKEDIQEEVMEIESKERDREEFRKLRKEKKKERRNKRRPIKKKETKITEFFK